MAVDYDEDGFKVYATEVYKMQEPHWEDFIQWKIKKKALEGLMPLSEWTAQLEQFFIEDCKYLYCECPSNKLRKAFPFKIYEDEHNGIYRLYVVEDGDPIPNSYHFQLRTKTREQAEVYLKARSNDIIEKATGEKVEEKEPDYNIVMPFIMAKSLATTVANFDWDKAFKIDWFLRDRTEEEDFEEAFDEFKEETIEEFYKFIEEAIREHEDDYWEEYRNFKFEYVKNKGVSIIYQPVTWVDYD